MTRLVQQHINSENMPHLSASSASIKTTNISEGPNSLHKPSRLSISQVQSNDSGSSSSKSSTSPVEVFPPQSGKLSPASAREKRRKLRSTRTNSLLNFSNSSSLRSRKDYLSHNANYCHQDQNRSDSDDDEPVFPRQRLKLSHSVAITPPPTIPEHIMIPRSQYSHLKSAIVEPSYEIPRKTPNDTHTCIRTSINSHSVSISSQPPPHFSKRMLRLSRMHKSNQSSTSPDNQLFPLEMKRLEELDKWWYWSKNCKFTGDGNKSSHLTPLPCLDLKRKIDHSSDLNQLLELKIITKTICESSLDQQNFYYSG